MTDMSSAQTVDQAVERAIEVLSSAPACLASDFDGTLSPITWPPEAAELLPGVRPALNRLTDRLALVAVVSGRPVSDLVRRVALPAAVFIGNHGLERWHEGEAILPAPTTEEMSTLSAARDALRNELAGEPHVEFEDKNMGLAVHYRDVADPDAMHRRILDLARRLEYLGLTPREGKRVIELRFSRSPTKGSSVEWLVDEYDLKGVVFIGDDLTDVDAFRALRDVRQRGVATLSVAVLGAETPPAVRESADAAVEGPEGVAELLRRLGDDPRLKARQGGG